MQRIDRHFIPAYRRLLAAFAARAPLATSDEGVRNSSSTAVRIPPARRKTTSGPSIVTWRCRVRQRRLLSLLEQGIDAWIAEQRRP